MRNTRRIISLLPACTEIACALDLEDCLVGRSHECDFPESVKALPACTRAKIDSTASSAEIDREVRSLVERALSVYELDAERLRELRPDVVLTQTQCEVCAVSLSDVEKELSRITGISPKIISYSPNNFAEVWEEIAQVARALGIPAVGKRVITELKERLVDVIQQTCMIKRRPSVACVEWMDPLMISGNWVPDLVELAGGQNLFGESGQPSPRVEWRTLTDGNPDVIYLMPCGFSIERTREELAAWRTRPEWPRVRAVRKQRVFLVDGNHYFNRPGPRLIDSAEILAETLHPKLFDLGHEGTGWVRAE